MAGKRPSRSRQFGIKRKGGQAPQPQRTAAAPQPGNLNGLRMETYYFRCLVCHRFDDIKDYSCRFQPDKFRSCRYCCGTLRPCVGSELAEAVTSIPLGPDGRKYRDQHWYRDVYLKSDLWRGIKRVVLERDGGRCAACSRQAEVVHHRSYDRDVLDGHRNDLLVSLCRSCHESIEFLASGEKANLNEANQQLKRLGVAVPKRGTHGDHR